LFVMLWYDGCMVEAETEEKKPIRAAPSAESEHEPVLTSESEKSSWLSRVGLKLPSKRDVMLLKILKFKQYWDSETPEESAERTLAYVKERAARGRVEEEEGLKR